MFIKKYFYYSAFSGVTSAATTAPTTTAPTTLLPPPPPLPTLGRAPCEWRRILCRKRLVLRNPRNPPHVKRRRRRSKSQAARSRRARAMARARGRLMVLPDQVEQDLVEWLQGNSYLWLRSSKDYHRKKSAWEMKAQEIGVTFKHLQNWWKNLKDWYVKLSKKTSGQATKLLTDRDKWVLKNIAFYKSNTRHYIYLKSFEISIKWLNIVILLYKFLTNSP